MRYGKCGFKETVLVQQLCTVGLNHTLLYHIDSIQDDRSGCVPLFGYCR